MSFWSELRSRNVVKVGAAYLIVAWLLIQIAAAVFPQLGLPVWSQTLVTVLLILVFPIALLLAWAYELTPDGIRRTRQVPLESSVRHVTGQKLNYIVTGLLAAAVAFIVVDVYLIGADETPQSAPPSPADASLSLPVPPPARQTGPRGRYANSVAVLPFDNLSESVDDEHFAAGLHDEVLNQLSKLRDLHVTSRSSVLRYADAANRPSMPEIAEQFNVETVMEATVRYAGNEFMVTAQLIDAETDSHLLSETFRADRSNTEDLFSIQIDIATAIAESLGAEISSDDRRRIDRVPTESSAAYARYLRAREFIGTSDLAAAMDELDRAIEIDPAFAEAYAQRAYLYTYGQILSQASGALSPRRQEDGGDFETLALENADRALELFPGLGLAWVARALTHQFHFRWNEARDAFVRAVELSPNDPDVLREYGQFLAYIGASDQALEVARKAAALDPNGTLTLSFLGQIAAQAGNAEEAAAALETAVSVNPANVVVNMLSGLFEPDADEAERRIRTADGLVEGDDAMMLPGIADGYRRLGLEQEAERALDRYEQWGREAEIGAGSWAQYYLMRGDLDRAYEWLETAVERIESGNADRGFIALQTSFANPGNPALSDARFQRLLERLEALRRID